MKILFYNICLLITKDKGENFNIVRFQTDNTLNIRMKTFMNKEEIEIIKIKLIVIFS